MGVAVDKDGVESCSNCGAEKLFWEKKNLSRVYLDYEWWCGICKQFVRLSNN